MYNLDDKFPLCPYCGKRIDDKDRTVDHILPKSVGRNLCWYSPKLVTFMKSSGYVGNPVNMPNNLICAHKFCNRRKGSDLFIPDWSPTGSCKYWEVRYLRGYAQYLYLVSDSLIQYYTRLIELNPALSTMAASWRYAIELLQRFQVEYTHRSDTGNWYIDNI